MARASAVWERPIGFRNSSSRISPGCGLGRRSVVVDDLDFVGIALSPDEADPPLVVDADRMLTAPIALQGLQPVARRHAKIIETDRVVEKTQFAQSNGLNVAREAAAAEACPDRGRFLVAVARDHGRHITQNVMRSKRIL